MSPQQPESLTKAAQCADLLVSDIREAHRLACETEPVLEIVLRDLIGDARKVCQRLEALRDSVGGVPL